MMLHPTHELEPPANRGRFKSATAALTLSENSVASSFSYPFIRVGYILARCANLLDHFNHQSLNNLTPSVVYFGRDKEILQQRERIKQNTLKARRLQHRKQTA